MSNFTALWLSSELAEKQHSQGMDKNVFLHCENKNVCGKNRTEFASISAHKSLVAAISPLLRSQIESCSHEDDIHVYLPDISVEDAKGFLDLIYTGVTKSFEIETFSSIASLLQIAPFELVNESSGPKSEHETAIAMSGLSGKSGAHSRWDEIEPPLDDLSIDGDEEMEETTFVCRQENCSSVFTSHSNLRRHTNNIHSGSGWYFCHLCDKKYRHKTSLDEHVFTHDERKRHLCDICGKSFHTKDLHASHRRSHGDRKYKCSVCGDSFKQRTVLHQHKIVRHGHGKRSFDCLSCGKSFTTKQNLTTHSRVHTGEAPYSCDVCNLSFKRNHHYKKHLTTISHLDKILTPSESTTEDTIKNGNSFVICWNE